MIGAVIRFGAICAAIAASLAGGPLSHVASAASQMGGMEHNSSAVSQSCVVFCSAEAVSGRQNGKADERTEDIPPADHLISSQDGIDSLLTTHSQAARAAASREPPPGKKSYIVLSSLRF